MRHWSSLSADPSPVHILPRTSQSWMQRSRTGPWRPGSKQETTSTLAPVHTGRPGRGRTSRDGNSETALSEAPLRQRTQRDAAARAQQMAGGLGIKGVGGMRKSQLIDAIKAAQSGGQAGGQPQGAQNGAPAQQAAAPATDSAPAEKTRPRGSAPRSPRPRSRRPRKSQGEARIEQPADRGQERTESQDKQSPRGGDRQGEPWRPGPGRRPRRAQPRQEPGWRRPRRQPWRPR